MWVNPTFLAKMKWVLLRLWILMRPRWPNQNIFTTAKWPVNNIVVFDERELYLLDLSAWLFRFVMLFVWDNDLPPFSSKLTTNSANCRRSFTSINVLFIRTIIFVLIHSFVQLWRKRQNRENIKFIKSSRVDFVTLPSVRFWAKVLFVYRHSRGKLA